MADIFISYSHRDKEKVELLARIFAEWKWSVWYDPLIPNRARFEQVIRQEIANAKLVIVCWSVTASQSGWVKDEAALGLDKSLFVSLDGTQPPVPFDAYQAPSLRNWYGGMLNRHLKNLLIDIRHGLGELPKGAGDDAELTQYFARPQLALNYHVVALAGAYYALATWIVTQQKTFRAPLLIDTRQVPGALIALIVVSALLIAGCRMLTAYASALQDEHWSRRVPHIGHALPPVVPGAANVLPKVLLGVEVFMPCAALYHFGSFVVAKGRVVRNPSGEEIDYWTHFPEAAELFSDAYRFSGTTSPQDGVTFFAAAQTYLVVLLVAAAWMAALRALKEVLWR